LNQGTSIDVCLPSVGIDSGCPSFTSSHNATARAALLACHGSRGDSNIAGRKLQSSYLIAEADLSPLVAMMLSL